MSSKSKTLNRPTGRRPDRPFDPSLLDRARAIASRYQIVVHFEDGEWYGRGLELPMAMNDGETPDACIANTRAILTTAVAVMLEDGQTPPRPAASAEPVRSQQVNVRLTDDEKAMMESASQRKGFRGISDFVRAAALTEACR